MNLEKKEQELLIRAFTYYYENHIWDEMVKEDHIKASVEDYSIRELTTKLGIKGMFPDEIKMRL